MYFILISSALRKLATSSYAYIYQSVLKSSFSFSSATVIPSIIRSVMIHSIVVVRFTFQLIFQLCKYIEVEVKNIEVVKYIITTQYICIYVTSASDPSSILSVFAFAPSCSCFSNFNKLISSLRFFCDRVTLSVRSLARALPRFPRVL
jgi:hypothetical protein